MAPSLISAVRRSDYEEMRSAVAEGANLNEWDETGMTPLLCAVFRNDVQAVRLLLEAGADPNVRSSSGDSPLWHAEDDFGLEEITALLRARGARK
jgi:ankyrin repeat protein